MLAHLNHSHLIMFPILGGRLLKEHGIDVGKPTYRVSNPWREAIEDGASELNVQALTAFPILGGRLLKV